MDMSAALALACRILSEFFEQPLDHDDVVMVANMIMEWVKENQ